jgi:hypothetical protein
VTIKSYEPHQLHSSLGRTEGPDRDDSCLCLRKPERAGGKRLLLPSRSAKPNGSQRVDDPATWEIKARGRFRIADVAAAK